MTDEPSDTDETEWQRIWDARMAALEPILGTELAYARSTGLNELLELLKKHDVFPYTVPGRSSVPLPSRRSILGKLFGN